MPVSIEAFTSVVWGKSLEWWHVPSWLETFFGNSGVQIFLGALIAGLVGLTTNKVQMFLDIRRARQSWGALLYDQLATQKPLEYPIRSDPPTVTTLTYSAIPHLFQPSVLKLPRESALLESLSFLEAAINNFNNSATAYNSAWANGVNPETLQKCKNDVGASNIDYKNAHKRVFGLVDALYEPKEQEDPTLP